MKDTVIVKVTAIICLTLINVFALMHGIDSVLTGTICSLIGGVAGYEFGMFFQKRREKYYKYNR